MKATLCIGALLATTAVFASESSGESRFHLLSTKCEAETESGPETTPQSPPLSVDDPATPGCNKWEINILADSDITSAQRTSELPLLDVNYGIGDNLQLKYEVPYVNNQSQDATVGALGESKVGIKYMFFEDEKSKLQFAIYPQLSFVKSDSDAVNKGLASPGTITTIPLLMSAKLGEVAAGEIKLTGNFGYNISSKLDLADSISASIGLGAPLRNNISIMGELTTDQAMKAMNDEARDQVIKVDLGLVGTLSNKFLTFGALGHSLSSSDGLSHTYGLVGFRFLFDGYKMDSKKTADNSDLTKRASL